jgi:hypothetical protein
MSIKSVKSNLNFEYKLCIKQLHWYVPEGNGRGCPECRREYARNKYKTDPAYRQKRIQSAIEQERKNQIKYNERKRRRYQADKKFRETKLTKLNAAFKIKWHTDVEWREAKKKKTEEWKRKNKSKVRHYEKLKKAKRLSRVVSWANKEAIQEIYRECFFLTQKTGIKHHVDHVYPLISDFMCGLHVENNLQILTAAENCSKGNRIWPGQLHCQKQSIYDIFPKELTDLLND